MSAPSPFRTPHSAFRIGFTLNGAPVSVSISASDRLLDTLREGLGLTGTKEGCGEGECGSCTVRLDGLPVCACLVPSYQARGRRVDTVEGIDPAALTPYLESGATQCGACTPGVVMAAEWIRAHPDLLATHSIRELMAGNLCRCTGYDGIVDAIERALADGGPRG
ncbi:MAG TPA: (2Fe-2S)-binding protein [Gemmatimonadales bacterium]|nr:(2Fe-2S)-binding protein [Gemmatimonadales bacterium]